jgi:3-phosphoglycerate kinase
LKLLSFFKEKYAGKLLLDEIGISWKAVANPIHPFTAVIGGAKFQEKLTFIVI